MGKVKKGTGITRHSIDYDKKTLSIDFSGDYDGDCFRNDASLFFFAANSYFRSHYLLDRELKKCFENETNVKLIEHLVMPYFFNFRHYVELEIKALIIAITGEYPATTHDLIRLKEALGRNLDSITYKDKDDDKARMLQEELKEQYEIVNNCIDDYYKMEPAWDYYRYLFHNDRNRGIHLEKPTLSINYNTTHALFCSISTSFNRMCECLNHLDIYVYNII